jgi:hypothetical protein
MQQQGLGQRLLQGQATEGREHREQVQQQAEQLVAMQQRQHMHLLQQQGEGRETLSQQLRLWLQGRQPQLLRWQPYTGPHHLMYLLGLRSNVQCLMPSGRPGGCACPLYDA